MAKRRNPRRTDGPRRPLPADAPALPRTRGPSGPLHGFGTAIFFASGFAGLIYESIWTHYLKLFLGHAAYAQTLVLAMFMGGMAVGAALAARGSGRLRRPLLAYAAIELAIGVLAIGFHPVFVGVTEGLYGAAFGGQLAGEAFGVVKWVVGAMLILPQSVLLGATFPVFAAAATREAPAAPGRPVATLYFANSIGGAAGILASGFVLVPELGLPGTIVAAGLLNVAIAAIVARLAKANEPAAAEALAAPEAPAPGAAGMAIPPARAVRWLFVATAFLTGFSSFVYEIGWIRMLSLVLGSATHSFELMLSSFILGLALGGLWIRSRIDTAREPGRLLAYIQIAMGAAAIATIPLHSLAFDAIAWTVTQAPKTDGGYALFNVVRYGLSSLVMFPAAFCAGMTLPLITRLLYAAPQQGERAIGIVYSANTVGGILGVVVAVHLGLPLLGIEWLVSAGALIDVALGAVLLAVFGGRRRLLQAGVAVAAAAAGAVAAAASFDPQRITSGVFRTGKARMAATVVDVAHGKTATISIDTEGDVVTIRTNGKPDAQANVRVPTAYPPDEVTARLLGALPLLLHPDPRRVANIGMGSGLTGETILGDPRVATLDTIEIESAVVRLARRFGDLNRRVYDDPRSAIHIDDAKAFFATRGKVYDVIVSEPSNPWVSGVSGLFSVEFYRHAARYLADGGLFVQWVQTYEIDPDRLASVLLAVGQAFDDYLIVSLDDGDLLLAASARGKVVLPPDAFARLAPGVRERLRAISVATQSDITFRVAGNKALVAPWLADRRVVANSDYHPYLDTHADRDRFLAEESSDLQQVALAVWPIAEVLGARPPLPTPSAIRITPHLGPRPPWLASRLVLRELFGPDPDPAAPPIPARLPPQLAREGEEIVGQCRNPPEGDAVAGAARLGTRVLPFVSADEGRRVLDALAPVACLRALYGTQAQWRSLLAEVAARNAPGFGAIAERMLGDGLGSTPVRTEYLLGLALLSRAAAGDAAGARAVWGAHAARALGGKPPELPLDVLRARAMAVPAR